MVLYVYCIQQRFSPPEHTQKYFDAAVKCQDHISGVASKESLHQRYYIVLEELRQEAMKHMQQRSRTIPLEGSRLQDISSGSALANEQLQSSIQEDSTFDSELGRMEFDYPNDNQLLSDGTVVGASPSSLMAEMTSWGEFDSLVSL